MRFLGTCLLVIGVAFAAVQQTATATPVAPNHELQTILDRLAGTVSIEQYQQLDNAVRSSPHLIDQLNGLAASGKLTELLVLSPAATSNGRKPGPFSAWTSGSAIVFTETLLLQLTKNREYDVVHPDDILPNNTTFVLGHLAFHLKASMVQPGDYPNMNNYVAAMLDQEARAYIQAWNDALDAAVVQNEGKSLTPRQVAHLMLNMRYRFAFLKALNHAEDKIHTEENGIIEESELNAKAIATALTHSSLADIQ